MHSLLFLKIAYRNYIVYRKYTVHFLTLHGIFVTHTHTHSEKSEKRGQGIYWKQGDESPSWLIKCPKVVRGWLSLLNLLYKDAQHRVNASHFQGTVNMCFLCVCGLLFFFSPFKRGRKRKGHAHCVIFGAHEVDRKEVCGLFAELLASMRKQPATNR